MKEILRLLREGHDDTAAPCHAVHCRYYQIAGITIRVTADLPIHDRTFQDKFGKFLVATPGNDIVSLHHRFTIPDLAGKELGREVYRKQPWIIHRQDRCWLYQAPALHRVAIFSEDHSRGLLHSDEGDAFRRGNLDELTLLPSDQILLARLLPDRQACLIHAAGMVLNGEGFLFVGHSEAGKSTMVTMLREEGEILCDDRVIVRRWPDGFRIHGTWCHGDVPDVSATGAPLRGVLFLEKSGINRLDRIGDRREIARRLPLFVIKPLVTADWWDKILALMESITREVPVYNLQFDRSGRVKELLRQLAPDE